MGRTLIHYGADLVVNPRTMGAKKTRAETRLFATLSGLFLLTVGSESESTWSANRLGPRIAADSYCVSNDGSRLLGLGCCPAQSSRT